MIILTGASGYLGRALAPGLARCDALETAGRRPLSGYRNRPLDLTVPAGFREAITGANTVIHCAGLAHNRGEANDYLIINERASMALADAALAAGARRFIYVSSLNIVPMDADSAIQPAASLPMPEGAYAISKWRAERALTQLLAHSGCELLIVRPALIYDVELTANLAQLARIATWLPVSLPDLGVRAMIARNDLVALIALLATQPSRARNPDSGVQIFAAMDGEAYSARRIGMALGAARRVALPDIVWRMAARCRDLMGGGEAGSTWRSLASPHWHGAAPAVEGWMPSYTLESCLSQGVESAST